MTESNGKLVAKVKVTNTGSTAGKEVVQLYFNAPYTQKDKDAKVEKPVKNLVAFAKLMFSNLALLPKLRFLSESKIWLLTTILITMVMELPDAIG